MERISRYSWCCLLLLLALDARAQSIYFEQIAVTSPEPVRLGGAALADYDQDGDYDLLLTGALGSFENPAPITQLYRNDGDTEILIENAIGQMVEVPAVDFVDAINIGTTLLPPVWQSAASWADYDRDGDLDLAISGLRANGELFLGIFSYTGVDLLFLGPYTLPGLRSGDLDWGDADNDGDLDLAACGLDVNDDPVLTIYVNGDNVGTGFQARNSQLVGVAHCTLEWGDYDVDADLDLLVTGIEADGSVVTRIYRNDGGGAFTPRDYQLKGLLYATGTWGDYDADGDLDVLVSGARLSPHLLEGEIKVYRNDRTSFSDVTEFLEGSFENDETLGRYQGSAAWGDFDNSGYFDFLVTGAKTPLSAETFQLYFSDRGRRFVKSGPDRYDGGLFGDAAWADYDLDQDLDAIVVGEAPGKGLFIYVLRNTLAYGIRVPVPPTNTQALVAGSTVTLSWSGATDRQTPVEGLTYNLRVSREPGGVDIVSPMADPSTGVRFVSRRGNVGHNTSWALRGLPAGAYYWSVQAVDQTYSGGMFTPEASFTVGAN